MKDDKKYFIIEWIKYKHSEDTYTIYDGEMFDLTTATRKLLALDTLNKHERTSYHLQDVDKGLLPLVLTEEVKKNGEDIDLDDMPF